MPLPHAVARFNKHVTNRFLEPLARRASGFAVVHHRGRVSGRSYRTPLNVFPTDDGLIIALTYGPDVDWLRNVQSGPSELERNGEIRSIAHVRLVARSVAWPVLPVMVKLVLRLLRIHHFCLVSIDEVNTSQ